MAWELRFSQTVQRRLDDARGSSKQPARGLCGDRLSVLAMPYNMQ